MLIIDASTFCILAIGISLIKVLFFCHLNTEINEKENTFSTKNTFMSSKRITINVKLWGTFKILGHYSVSLFEKLDP